MAADRPVISLFSGALGLDLGLERAGCRIAVAVECNRFAQRTIELNRPVGHPKHIPLIKDKIEEVATSELLRRAGLKKGGAFVVTGGPSCQAFSTAGQRGSIKDRHGRGTMFREFLRVVREAQPRFFVMENVRGVLSAAVRHRPLSERGAGYPPLKPDEALGSALRMILRELSVLDYYIVVGVVNAADYGVPQTRERVVFLGSRDGEPLELPIATHAKTRTAGMKLWRTLRQTVREIDDPEPEFTELCKSKRKYLAKIKEGGNWRDLPPKMQREALGRAYDSWGGRVGFFRRLWWDKPSPSLNTRPDSKATMLIHPEELRPLSIAEYAALQQFPSDWQFAGATSHKYVQIGNAVPVGLGEAIGMALVAATKKRIRVEERGLVRCSPELIEKLANRPRTVLNPGRMRDEPDFEETKKWIGRERSRRSVMKYLTPI